LSSKKYKGTLELNWINKDKSLIYEYDDDGNPTKPQWVERDDIRVSEPRILKLKGEYGDPDNENMLIKGDNLLALRTLVEEFKNRKEKDKVKCIYIDPPFNTQSAFENYDDSLEHSEWLTMMRDRLILLKKLLRKDGVIFVHIDHHEIGHLRVLMDGIFSRKNFVQIISVKKATPAGFKTINPGPVNVTEFILMYAKDKRQFPFKKMFVESDYVKDYNHYILNPNDPPEEWRIGSIREIAFRELDVKDMKEAKKKYGSAAKILIEELMADFALNNSEVTFATYGPHRPSGILKELIDKSKKDSKKVFYHERKGYDPFYLLNGRLFAFYSKKLREIDGKKVPTQILTDFWGDLSWDSLSSEGSVTFRASKKPEELLKRIIGLGSELDDLILDSFAGSGTTGAVAHKLGRRWILVELGKHAETHCLKRLKRVIDNNNPDTTGISKLVGWKGGGGFRFYVLGDSLLKDHDINWGLEREEIARALFMNFDYGFNGSLEDGVFVGRRGHRYGLCLVSKDVKILYAERIGELIEEVNEKFDDLVDLEIYTNMGVGVRREDLPENVTVKKIPESILRKYKL